MEKRLLILLVALIGMTMQSVGQNNVPKLDKIIKVKSGVNIRKAPRVNSQRLITYYDESQDIGDGDGTIVKWEEPSDRRYKPTAFYADEVEVVNGEYGDWYRIYISIVHSYGYIAKQFCQVVDRTPLIFSSEQPDFVKDAKKHNNYFVFDDSDLSGEAIALGRIVDGMCVICSNLYYQWSEDEKSIILWIDANTEKKITFGNYLLDYSQNTEYPDVNWNKLTEKDFQRVINAFSGASVISRVYYGIENSPRWYMMELIYKAG